jgi:hypothetical protein
MPGTRPGMTENPAQPRILLTVFFASGSKDVDGRDEPGHDG